MGGEKRGGALQGGGNARGDGAEQGGVERAGTAGCGRVRRSRAGRGGAGRGWTVAAQGKTERDEANRRGTENQETVRVVLDLSDWCVVGRGWADRGLVGAGRARASGVSWGGT